MENLKYEYHLFTWGGFYNDQYKKDHIQEEGHKWFDTELQRSKYIEFLREIEVNLNARHLVVTTSEGYNTRVRTTCHRVIEYKGKEYYSKDVISIPNFTYSHAEYHMTWKWYPGFNDYPLGEDFDYDQVVIKQEWITGAFDIKEE